MRLSSLTTLLVARYYMAVFTPLYTLFEMQEWTILGTYFYNGSPVIWLLYEGSEETKIAVLKQRQRRVYSSVVVGFRLSSSTIE